MSEVDWQMAPWEMSSRRSVRPLVMLPLWATARPPADKFGKQRLDIAQDGFAGGGIADMAEAGAALQAVDDLLAGEMIADQAHAAFGVESARRQRRRCRRLPGRDAAGRGGRGRSALRHRDGRKRRRHRILRAGGRRRYRNLSVIGRCFVRIRVAGCCCRCLR